MIDDPFPPFFSGLSQYTLIFKQSHIHHIFVGETQDTQLQSQWLSAGASLDNSAWIPARHAAAIPALV